MRMLNPYIRGRFLRTEIIEPHHLPVTGISRPTVSSLLNAKAGLYGDIALRFICVRSLRHSTAGTELLPPVSRRQMGSSPAV